MNDMVDKIRFHENSCFAKTNVGVSEIQTRALGLNPLLRRLLVLIDGKRSCAELGGFVSGHDLQALLDELLSNGCIEEVESVKSAKVVAPVAPAIAADPNKQFIERELAKLPASESRTPKDLRMARDFMMNTVNTMFGQYTRLTLVQAIHACQSTDELRKIYPEWVHAMLESAIGARRLPELSQQLAKTL